MEHRWTITELARALELALRLAPQNGQASARVREVPDKRTIRYYNTLGMVDRPEMAGRTAYYSERHLWQLLAIKRLQAAGETLVQVQEKLAGASDTQLKRLAALPEGFWQAHEREQANAESQREKVAGEPLAAAPMSPPAPAKLEESSANRPRPFWAAEPSASPTSVVRDVAYSGMASKCSAAEGAALAPRPAVHLSLEDGITLVLEGAASVQFAHLSPVGRQRLAELAGQIAEVLAREHPAGHDVHFVHTSPPQGNADSGASSV